jgi:hypothetical protein
MLIRAEKLEELLAATKSSTKQEKDELYSKIRVVEANAVEAKEHASFLKKSARELESEKDKLEKKHRIVQAELESKSEQLETLYEEKVILLTSSAPHQTNPTHPNNPIIPTFLLTSRRQEFLKCDLEEATNVQASANANLKTRITKAENERDALKEQLEALQSDKDSLLKGQHQVKHLEKQLNEVNALLQQEREARESERKQEELEQANRAASAIEESAKLEERERENETFRAALEDAKQAKLELAAQAEELAKQAEVLKARLKEGQASAEEEVALRETMRKKELDLKQKALALATKQKNIDTVVDKRRSKRTNISSVTSRLTDTSKFIGPYRARMSKRRTSLAMCSDLSSMLRTNLNAAVGKGAQIERTPEKPLRILLFQNRNRHGRGQLLLLGKAINTFDKLLQTITDNLAFTTGACRKIYCVDQEAETFTRVESLAAIKDEDVFLCVAAEAFNAKDPERKLLPPGLFPSSLSSVPSDGSTLLPARGSLSTRTIGPSEARSEGKKRASAVDKKSSSGAKSPIACTTTTGESLPEGRDDLMASILEKLGSSERYLI